VHLVAAGHRPAARHLPQGGRDEVEMIDVPVDNHTLLTVLNGNPVVTGYGGGPEVALMDLKEGLLPNKEIEASYRQGAYLAVALSMRQIATLVRGGTVDCYAVNYDRSRTADIRLRKITPDEFRAEVTKAMQKLPENMRTEIPDEVVRQMTDHVDI
jgi:hypothetical protein